MQNSATTAEGGSGGAGTHGWRRPETTQSATRPSFQGAQPAPATHGWSQFGETVHTQSGAGSSPTVERSWRPTQSTGSTPQRSFSPGPSTGYASPRYNSRSSEAVRINPSIVRERPSYAAPSSGNFGHVSSGSGNGGSSNSSGGGHASSGGGGGGGHASSGGGGGHSSSGGGHHR